MSDAEINNLFTHHAPKDDQIERYKIVRDAGQMLAFVINKAAPNSAEKTLAIRKVQEAVMWANAAIAINE